MKQQYFILILSSLFLFACSSGKNRLEKGDYDVAVYKAVKRLQHKPNHSKATKVLKEAYTLAVNEHMSRIEYHDKSSNQFKYDLMVREYRQIGYLNNSITKYPKYSKLVGLVDISDELEFSKSQAALAHEKEAEKLMLLQSKQRSRDAYFHFIEANSFIEGYISVATLDHAQEEGTVNVVVEFSNGKFFRDYNSEQVYANVMNSFKGTRYRFLRVFESGENTMKADEIIQIEIDEAHIGGVNVSKSIIELKKEDVYMGEAETDSGEIVKVYGTVTADYIEYCKTITTHARLMIRRMDGSTLAIKQTQVFPSSYNWTEKWATYRGDKRALTDGQLDFAKRSEPMPPNPQWLFAQTTKPLVGQSIDYLRGQFNYLR